MSNEHPPCSVSGERTLPCPPSNNEVSHPPPSWGEVRGILVKSQRFQCHPPVIRLLLQTHTHMPNPHGIVCKGHVVVVKKHYCPFQPRKYQWKPNEELEFSPLTKNKQQSPPQELMKAEWGTWILPPLRAEAVFSFSVKASWFIREDW